MTSNVCKTVVSLGFCPEISLGHENVTHMLHALVCVGKFVTPSLSRILLVYVKYRHMRTKDMWTYELVYTQECLHVLQAHSYLNS